MANVKIDKRLPHIFAIALTISELLQLLFFYHKKVGHGYGVQFSHWPFDGKCQNLQTLVFTFLIFAKV